MFIRTFENHTRSFAVIFTLALAACTDDGESMEGATETGTDTETETGGEMALAIVGTYMDEFGDTHTITESLWTNSAGEFAISEWNNEEMWLVAQNAESNEFSPLLWSRFDWTWDGDVLYYCQSVFDGATMEDALAGSANRDSLDMGCGGFPWTRLN